MARGAQIDFLLPGLVDESGNPLAGGKVYWYSPGTTTPKNVYTDSSRTVAAANPSILTARGMSSSTGATFQVLYAFGGYLAVITDSDGVLQFSMDNLLFGIGADAQRGDTVATTDRQTTFTCPFTFDTGSDNLIVSVNGVLINDSDYTKPTTTSIQFSASQASFIRIGDVVEFIEV